MARPLDIVTVYADDTDASVTRRITSAAGIDQDYTPVVAVDDGDYEITATWLGDPSPARELRVPVADLPVGNHRLYLQVPGFNDLSLGSVTVKERT